MNPASDPFRSLYDVHSATLARYLRRFGVTDVDDVVQEVFVVASRRLSDIRSGSERAFLFAVARRVALRTLQRERARAGDETSEATCDHAADIEAALETMRRRAYLEEVMLAMDDDLRDVFELFECEELDKRAVAEALGIPVGTASSRRRRARAFAVEYARRFHPDAAEPLAGARSGLFLAGREWYAAHQVWEGYMARVDPKLREELPYLAERSWLSGDEAMKLYGASNNLGLSEEAQTDVGRFVSSRVNQAQVSELQRVARRIEDGGMWLLVRNAARIWRNAFDGGTFETRTIGPQHAHLVCRAPMARLRFFRLCVAGAVESALTPFSARVRLLDEGHSSFTVSVEAA